MSPIGARLWFLLWVFFFRSPPNIQATSTQQSRLQLSLLAISLIHSNLKLLATFHPVSNASNTENPTFSCKYLRFMSCFG